MVDVPTLGWPLSRDGAGGVRVVEQGSVAAVRESVARIGMVEQGSLRIAPWLGLPAIEFKEPPTEGQVAGILESQERQADVRVARLPDFAAGEGWERLRVSVGLAGEDANVG